MRMVNPFWLHLVHLGVRTGPVGGLLSAQYTHFDPLNSSSDLFHRAQGTKIWTKRPFTGTLFLGMPVNDNFGSRWLNFGQILNALERALLTHVGCKLLSL